MEGATAKQDLLLNIDAVIFWRHGVLDHDPLDDDNAHALKALLAMREAICMVRDQDRELSRLAALHGIAELDGIEEQVRQAELDYLRRYGNDVETVDDPHSFLHDLIQEVVAAVQWSDVETGSMPGGGIPQGHNAA